MRIGDEIIRPGSIDSTNEYALSLIKQKEAVNGMVVTATEQTKGKGADNSNWESMPGKNLTLSILVKPEGLQPAHQFMLNKITSLAVLDFVSGKIQTEAFSIKWPNDIYWKYKKAAGILISNIIEGQQISWSVIGVGININQAVFTSDAPNPVSLHQISGQEYELETCLKQFCECFEKWFVALCNKNTHFIDSHYIASLFRYGVVAKYIINGQVTEAKITGVGEYGHLKLQPVNGKALMCDLKEVKFLL